MVKDVSGREELLTVEDLAALLRVPRSWVYSHSGDLGAYKLGKYLRFDWERVRERLAKLGRQPNDPILGSSNERLDSAIERICNK
jgi:excisionase family DNA binding protein